MQENDSRAIALIVVCDLDSIKGYESIQSAPPNTVRAKSRNQLVEKSSCLPISIITVHCGIPFGARARLRAPKSKLLTISGA